MATAILDDREHIRRFDNSGMATLIAGLPDQFAAAPHIIQSVAWPSWKGEDFDGIAVLGMGGSAIGGDLVRSFLAGTLAVPMTVIRDYRLPKHVTSRTLVLASSYSGNTEETLSAVEEARQRGCRIVALCSGGELARLAAKDGWPRIPLPPGFPPRAALGYSFSLAYLTLGKLGFTSDPVPALLKLAEFLAARNTALLPDVPVTENEAKRLAMNIHGKIPVIYGAAGTMAVAALRWKGQFCENAKNLAFAGEAPEFNHNEIVGLGLPEGSPERLIAILLRSPDDHPRVARRFEVVRSLVEQKGVGVEKIWTAGDDPLQRLFSTIQLGDWASFYLAMQNGVDPTPIKAIDDLKKMLA